MSTKQDRFFEVFGEIYTLNESQKVTETTLESLNLDSFDRVELFADIEEEFDLDLDDKSADSFKTIGEILDYIEKNGS